MNEDWIIGLLVFGIATIFFIAKHAADYTSWICEDKDGNVYDAKPLRGGGWNIRKVKEMKDKKKCTSKKTVDSFFVKQKVQCELKYGHTGPHERTTLHAHNEWWKEDEDPSK